MKLKQLSGQLQKLSNEELAAVLLDVFSTRVPCPEEQDFNKTRFFLGIASQQDEAGYLDPEGVPKWGPWTLECVAYPCAEEYGHDLELDLFIGPLYGFCQEGVCSNCGVVTCSNVKNGICPVCAEKVYMT